MSQSPTSDVVTGTPDLPAKGIVDFFVFLSCVSVALVLGCVIVVASDGSQEQLAPRLLETIGRAGAIGLPVAALYGAPVWKWLCTRIPSRGLLVVLAPFAGLLPGLLIFLIGVAASLSFLVFNGMFMMAAGAWSAVLGAILYFALAGRPLITTSLGGLSLILILAGWLSTWLGIA